jgi:phage tail sheath protein FI
VADPCLPGGAPTLPVPLAPSEGGPPRFGAAALLRVLQALITHCEANGDRVALLDPPFDAATDARLGLAAIRDVRHQFDSSYAALYFPWLDTPDPLPGAREPVLPVPPCGHVAGQIAASDLRIGVHKAPANSPLLLTEGTSFTLGEIDHGVLNADGINAIRAMPGRGLRIMGARLVSSDPDWRFLNVRRLMLMIERSLEAALQWAVFEGNDWLTRAKLQIGVDSFLRELWSRGALMGASADAAYFVRCDDGNNDAAARARGELMVEVGVAPSVPFEFVVLRIGRGANGFELAEADAMMVA